MYIVNNNVYVVIILEITREAGNCIIMAPEEKNQKRYGLYKWAGNSQCPESLPRAHHKNSYSKMMLLQEMEILKGSS